MYINPLSNFSLTVWANTLAKRRKTKTKKKKKADRGKSPLPMHEWKLPLCTPSPSSAVHPRGPEDAAQAASLQNLTVKPLLYSRDLFVSGKSYGATQHWAHRTPARLRTLPGTSLERRPKGDAPGGKMKRPGTSTGFFQLAFLAVPAALHLPMQDVIIQEGVKLCYRLAATFQLFLTRGWISLLWVSSAGAQLCFAPVPSLSLTSLPTTCLKECSEQEKKRNQSGQNFLPKARYLHLQHASNLWHHWPFKQRRRITARSNVK